MNSISAHISIAKCCLYSLQKCDESGLSHTPIDNNCRYCPIRRPLLEYAANNWYRHALKAQEEAVAERTDAARGATISSPG